MAELPAGTVTFLFTDIEGSTRLWEEHPEAMQGALALHDAILSDAVDTHGGALVKKRGDGVHAVFPTAHDAVASAVAMQRGLAAEPFEATGALRIRIGAHTCEAELRDGDYYGSGVNRAARLEGVAHGGQIVMSTVTAGLCDGRFTLVDLGEHRLRDLTRAERVWQVDLDGERFPRLRSLDNLPGNLPVQLTEFVGRVGDVAQIVEAIHAQRVVTLTGVGGVGKTRLALQVAAEVAERFQHGTWFVDLAPVASADGVLGATASALAVDPGGDTEEALRSALRKQRRLLVIDNCEHVLDEAARMVEALVRSCPDVAVLATSREGLGTPGERILTVRSMEFPSVDADAAAVVETEAVRLFVDRARSVRADLPLDDQTVAAIADICRRLDGIPLALELAAARMQSMSAVEIGERLDQRFRLLTRGSRAALGRQHTLQTTVDWSYKLLAEAEREVLTRSSVFAGGFTLQAAEHVVTCDDVHRFDVLDHLDSLVRRSMLMADEQDGVTRYRLLETIRQFAADRLESDGHADATRNAHLGWCRRFVGDASLGLHGPEGPTWVTRIERELDNWRAAVVYATETSDLDAIAELFGSIPTLALYSTHVGSALAASAVSAFPAVTDGGEPDHAATAALLALVGYEQYLRGNYDVSIGMLERACDLPQVSDLGAPDLACGFLFAATYFAQDFEAALEAADEALRIGTERADRYLMMLGNGVRAQALATLGRADEALDAAALIFPVVHEDSDLLLAMHASFMAGFTHAILDDDEDLATALLTRAATLATAFGNAFFASAALSYVAGRTDDVATTARQLQTALEVIRSLPQRDAARDQLEQVTSMLVRGDRHATAAIIDGASHHPEWNQSFESDARKNQQALVDALGQTRFDELNAQGRHLTIDEVLDLAIAELDAVIEPGDK